MKVLNSWLERQIVFCLVMLLGVPIGAAATKPPLPPSLAVGTTLATEAQTQSQTVGRETSGTVPEASPAAYPDSPGTLWTQTADQSQQTSAPQTTPTKQQNSAPAPVGTAAAPYEKPEGVSASKPAGAAIAPGKQRRIRSFAIRAGLLIGAGIAIGVVTAATLSSSSRPH